MTARTHALRVRISAPVDVDAVAAGIGHPLWVERIPAAVAERRRAAELAFPPLDDGVRATLLCHDEGADLVLVGRDPATLRRVGGSPEPESITAWQAALAAVRSRHHDDLDIGLCCDDAMTCAPPHQLTIHIGPDLRYEHTTDVAPEFAAQFVRHLARAHRQLVANPELPAADVELLDVAERQRIIDLRGPAAPTVLPVRIQDVFAARVAERPDAVAVCHRQDRLTYTELDELSDRMAAGLRAVGVRDRDRVGVCLDRSTHLVATLLAILKAGAAYTPMDPSYPDDRLAHTAADAELAVVVTTRPDFPAGHRVTPDDLLLVAAGPVPPAATTPDDPAYVIYTSGSTGRPKGVVVAHRNVISLLAATEPGFGIGPDDVWTWYHSSAFDFSVWEIWGCLLTGGRLVVVPFLVSRSPEEFRELLVTEGVTVLSQTPSAFGQLIDVERRRSGGFAVRLVVLGGEPLDARMLPPWFDRHPETECRVVNMFGITETTVHVTVGTIDRTRALAGSRTVGRPLPGWYVYVLDERGRLVPPGVAGEIHVGGAGVAIGYLNRPDLNAARFLPDPFAGGRLYRSGDLGRLLPDGTLEHLGRIDSQVKIRGFRIELDEIRAVLLEHRDVVAAAAAIREGDAATRRIDAYVVPDNVPADDVRAHAARLLPDYMVPATVTAIARLPLTANGKIDLTRLPAPAAAEPVPARPTGDLLRDLRDVWSAVLGVRVGPDDDFFELGGNSLLAIRIAARIRERGMPEVPVRDLYRHPTVRRLAAAAGDSASAFPGGPGHERR
jgi:amino acid adenylation domain-containing protein